VTASETIEIVKSVDFSMARKTGHNMAMNKELAVALFGFLTYSRK
jgi:hypothetical protein